LGGGPWVRIKLYHVSVAVRKRQFLSFCLNFGTDLWPLGCVFQLTTSGFLITLISWRDYNSVYLV